jgi:hypothetical protein
LRIRSNDLVVATVKSLFPLLDWDVDLKIDVVRYASLFGSNSLDVSH